MRVPRALCRRVTGHTEPVSGFPIDEARPLTEVPKNAIDLL
jgi:hypothetical protein